jgi:hypothetical protein
MCMCGRETREPGRNGNSSALRQALPAGMDKSEWEVYRHDYFRSSAFSSGPTMSSGSGNTMVEFLSAAITVSVSR